MHRLTHDRIRVYWYAYNVKIRYTYIHSALTDGKPPCSAYAILLISGIEAYSREGWTKDENRGEKERENGTEKERERGRGARIVWAWIRLIKLRIRAASRKWNYRGGKYIGLRTTSRRYHHHHHQKGGYIETGV